MSVVSAPIHRLRSFAGSRGVPPLVILAPALVVGAALLLPPVYLVVRALGGGGELWELLFRERVAEILGRTLLLVVTVTAASIVIALPLAWLTVRTDLPFRRLWAVLTPLPLVVPSYVAGFIVVVALGPKGMLQQALAGPFGIERLPDIHGFAGALLTLTFLSYPYVLITLRAGLFRIDPALEESARGLGLGPWGVFFRIICPLLRPAISAGGLLVGLYTLSDFGAVSLLQYETFTWAIFVQYDSALDRTLGAGLSLVLVIVALGWVGLELATRGRSRYYSISGAPSRPPGLVRLGRWRWPSLLFCAGVLAFGLALPMSILGYWVVRGFLAGESLTLVWEALRNSVYISALAAVAATGAAVPVAALSVRFPSLISAGLERLGYVGFALPGIAVALALVFFATNYALPYLSNDRAAGLGLCGTVSFPGHRAGPNIALADQPTPGGGGAGAGPGADERPGLRHASHRPARAVGCGVSGVPVDHEGVASHSHPGSNRLQYPGYIHLVGCFRGILRPGRHTGAAVNRGFGHPPCHSHAQRTPLGYNRGCGFRWPRFSSTLAGPDQNPGED